MSPANARRPRGPETRDALLAAARTLVERDGVTTLTTRRIADEAGLPLGALHYWFPDKQSLLREVIDAMLAEVRADVAAASTAGAGGDRLGAAYAAFTAMPPGRQVALFELTTNAIRDVALREQAARQYAAYRAAAAQGLTPWIDQAERTLPGGATALAALIVAVVDGVTLAQLADDDARGPEALALFAHLLALAGIGDAVP